MSDWDLPVANLLMIMIMLLVCMSTGQKVYRVQLGPRMIPKVIRRQRSPWLRMVERISVSNLCFLYTHILTR